MHPTSYLWRRVPNPPAQLALFPITSGPKHDCIRPPLMLISPPPHLPLRRSTMDRLEASTPDSFATSFAATKAARRASLWQRLSGRNVESCSCPSHLMAGGPYPQFLQPGCYPRGLCIGQGSGEGACSMVESGNEATRGLLPPLSRGGRRGCDI